jgi:hypothetical protein
MSSIAIDSKPQTAAGSLGRDSRAVERRGFNSTHWLVVAIVFAAAFLMYSFSWTSAPLANTDTPSYLEPLNDFLANHHFTQLHGRTPGLPLFLYLLGTGRAYFHATLLMHFVGVAALLFALSRLRVRAAFLWVVALLMLLPCYVQNTAWLGTEAITETFLALGFAGLCLFIVDRRLVYAVFSSFFFVWAGLTRPTNVFTPFVLAAILLLFPRKKVLRAAALLVLIPGLIIGSYISYTGVKFHYFGVSYLTGYHLSNATIELYEGIDNPVARQVLLQARTDMHVNGFTPNDAVWRARKELKGHLGLNDFQLAAFLLKMNVRLITHHPEAYLEEVARASCMYWFPYLTKVVDTKPFFKLVSDGIQLSVSAIFLLQVAMLGSLVAGGFMLKRKLVSFTDDRSLIYLLALAIIFQTQILSCAIVGGSNARYRSVTDPLILFAIALVADWCLTTWRASRFLPSSSSASYSDASSQSA